MNRFKLLNKELYCYSSHLDSLHKSLYSLAGTFITEEPPEMFDAKTILYPFSLYFHNNKRRIYYAYKNGEKKNWISKIKASIGYSDLNDFYTLKHKIGRGKFGIVKEAIHKKTNKKVAVKVLRKSKMTPYDIELSRREIEILKICQHPNIVRLLDIFENHEFFYIVLEFLAGGDLFTYLYNKEFLISESRACDIIHSISTALYFLHSYGITHRDLKPENILVVDETEESDVKISDFGLSKIIGPEEQVKEPFGTITFAAPEILQLKSYNKSVDIWSLGVIAYLLLTGDLPFDDEDNAQIIKKIINNPVKYNDDKWKNISPEAKQFVQSLLQKDPAKRISLENLLVHPWILKNKENLKRLREKSKEDDTNKFFVYSFSDPDSLKIIDEVKKRSKDDDFGGYS